VGRLDATNGTVLEQPVGPAPVAITATADVLVILEGMPDPPVTTARVNEVERLDPTTLEVIASHAVPPIPTAIAIAGATVLVGGVRSMSGYRVLDLSEEWRGPVPGRGSSLVATAGTSTWLLTGDVEAGRYSLHQVAAATGEVLDTVEIGGSGTDGLLAVGEAPWVAAVDQEGTRAVLVEVVNGTAIDPLPVPRVAAIAAFGDVIWWLTAEGLVNRVAHGVRADPVSIGPAGVALALGSSGELWASTGAEIVRLQPYGG
jgi:hypothetical protein